MTKVEKRSKDEINQIQQRQDQQGRPKPDKQSNTGDIGDLGTAEGDDAEENKPDLAEDADVIGGDSPSPSGGKP